MRRFPFKILFFCIFLPPVCYMLTLMVLEGYLKNRELANLDDVVIQNPEALYEGRYTVKDEINRNIREYLSRGIKYKLGVRTYILVKTKDDRILYPAHFGREPLSENYFSEPQSQSLNYQEVAAENYRILNEGLDLSVDVRVKHNSWLSNGILVFYILIALLIIRKFIWKRLEETEAQDKEQQERIQRLSDQLQEAESKLKQVGAKEQEYVERIARLNRDKEALSEDIDGLLEEMEGLETGLQEHRKLKEEMEYQVLELKEELSSQREKFQKPKKKKKSLESTGKRFSALYKNLAFTDRAVEGFLSLTDDFQLKAEEVIHKLNEDDSQISVKRKVFGKGGKMNVLEVHFAYSGRIYYQKDTQAKLKVLAVGTKNTQEKDLAYLQRSEVRAPEVRTSEMNDKQENP
ncbi:MAG: hypothetical protein P8175_08480 [Deltaproteobacteria bacterium]